MSVKAGQLLHIGNSFLIDRIQTGGAGSLNIPEEKIYELGSWKSVATVRDRPDLSFDLESFDVSTEIEAILLGLDPTEITPGFAFDFNRSKPVDIIAPFKGGANESTTSVRGVAIPHLTLESISYRFGVGQTTAKSVTLRGDSIYYTPGTPYFSVYTASGVGPYDFAVTPTLRYVERGQDVYAYSVTLLYADGTTKRLFLGSDYTNTATGFALAEEPPADTRIHVVYASTASAEFPRSVHEGVEIKPAAVRGKDIDVYVGVPGEELVRWAGVQSAEVTRRVNLEVDEELGNPNVVAQDYDVPEVSGEIGVKPASIEALFVLINQVTNTPADQTVGAHTSQPLELEVRVSDPITGARMQTIVVPDARFQPPPIQGRVQTKLETSFAWSSDAGDVTVFNGVRS